MGSWSRRKFLASAAATTIAAPFIRTLNGGTAQAADGGGGTGIAKRLIVFFSPNGTIHNHWRPTGGEFDFDFAAGSILEPLKAHKEDLIVLDGIDFYGVANHEPGMAAMLTGGGAANQLTGGKSLDQFVANQLNANTKFPSLDLGVQTSAWGASNQTRMCYSAPGTFVPPDDNPLSVYERMFGEYGASDAQKDKMFTRRKSILDLVSGELKQLRYRVGYEEKIKLDQHLESLVQLETSLSGSGSGDACAAPDSVLKVPTQEHQYFADIAQAQIDLMFTALACDMTRVASIQLSHTVGPHVFTWLGLTEGHHSLSHMGDTDVAGVAKYVKAERWITEQFVVLLEKLKNTPEPDGEGSMLDNSCLLWAQEMGDGRMHDCLSVPFVIAGKAGGAFQTGRYLNYQSEPHQKLLVSICHAMGLSNPVFGDPSHGAGPLSGLDG
jgi:hypothetical protein